MATTKPQVFIQPDAGLRLTDARTIQDAILYNNGAISTYGIVAAGTTQATATQLNSPYNQVDTAAASTGVNLPLSTGRRNTPFQNVQIVNNGANPLAVYGFQGSTDTINGIAATVGVIIPTGVVANFVSVKPGAWFTPDASAIGTIIAGIANGSFSQASSTVLTNVPGMSAILPAAGTYEMDIYLVTTNNGTGGIKLQLSGTGPITNFQADTFVYNTTTLTAESNPGTAGSPLVNAAVAATCVTTTGLLVTNAASTLQLQAAQNTSNGTALTITNFSYIKFTRLI